MKQYIELILNESRSLKYATFGMWAFIIVNAFYGMLFGFVAAFVAGVLTQVYYHYIRNYFGEKQSTREQQIADVLATGLFPLTFILLWVSAKDEL